MYTIGLDLSINSTGICVNRKGVTDYMLVIPESGVTKTIRNFEHPRLHYITYDKLPTRDADYTTNEYNKSVNLYNWKTMMCSVLKKHRKADFAVMEGVSYGSTSQSSLVDLAGVQYACRLLLQELGIPFFVVSPTSNKKMATGNGNATKEEMLFAWLNCDKTLKDVKKLKLDDLADAYFLSLFTV